MADNPFLKTVANLGGPVLGSILNQGADTGVANLGGPVLGQAMDSSPDILKTEMARLSQKVDQLMGKEEQEDEEPQRGFLQEFDSADKSDLSNLFAEDGPEPAHAQVPGSIMRGSPMGLLSSLAPKEQAPKEQAPKEQAAQEQAAQEQPYQVDQMDVTDMTVENLTIGEEGEAEEEEPAPEPEPAPAEEPRNRQEAILDEEMAVLDPTAEGTGQKQDLNPYRPKPVDMLEEGTGQKQMLGLGSGESEAQQIRQKFDRPWEPTATEMKTMKEEGVEFGNMGTSGNRPKSVQSYIDARLGKQQQPEQETELPRPQSPKPAQKPPTPPKPPASARLAGRVSGRGRGRSGNKGGNKGGQGSKQDGGKWQVDEMTVNEMTTPAPEEETKEPRGKELTEPGKDTPDEVMDDLNDSAKEIKTGMDELIEELHGTGEEITKLADLISKSLDRKEESEAPGLGDTATASKEDNKLNPSKMQIEGTLTVKSDGSATLVGQSLGTVPAPA